MTTRKNPGLGARAQAITAAVAASETPAATAGDEKPVPISIRLPKPMHKELRRLSYENETPIHGMILEGITLFLKSKGITL